MDRIDRIGPRPTPWLTPALDPDAEDITERRRREEERRRRKGSDPSPEVGMGSDPSPEVGMPPDDGAPPHRIDVRA